MANKNKTEVKRTFHTDPAHGWLSVKRDELEELGIAEKITQFSYQRGGSVYLEEDLDAGIYLDAMAARGVTVNMRESHNNRRSPVRGFEMYRRKRIGGD